jgi:hypothetical protein
MMDELKLHGVLFLAALTAVLVIYALVDSGGTGSLAHKVWL